MKVLVATHSYSGNGAAVMLLAVLEFWVMVLGWTVDVLLDVESSVPDELARIGVNVFPTADPSHYDFALINTVVSAHYVDLLAPRVRTILWVHEGETVLWGSSAPPAKWRHLFSLPWKIVFQTPWQPDVVFRSFLGLSNNAVCVRNGLPAIPAGLVPNSKRADKRRIVFVGGVYGRKRPHDLANAVLALGRSDVECVFVGPTAGIETLGSEEAQKIKSRPDMFILAGELDRKAGLEYLASADVFCLPSGDESQPIAPLEAAALDIPCALTDLPPYTGTWKHGVNCLLSPVGDPLLLGLNLSALLDSDAVRTRLVEQARMLVPKHNIASFVQRFTAEAVS
jgi:glycosyltransferase involved in cell wall biosynthesis